MRCRIACLDDACAIAVVDANAHAHPWSVSQVEDGMRRPGQVWVLEDDGGIVAWAAIQIVLDESELLQISVAPAQRRKGFGKALLAAILKAVGEQGVGSMFLEVRVGNRAAISMYQQAGFCEHGHRLGYYPSLNPNRPTEREDALLMAWTGFIGSSL